MATATSVQSLRSISQTKEELTDSVSGKLMTRAVTLNPCGCNFNHDTVIQILAGNKLCPKDATPIKGHIPNYTLRDIVSHLAEISGDFREVPAVFPVVTLSIDKSIYSSLAFGALKWEQYFGIKVVEPPLPSDIDEILASPCPFFPGKKVGEKHFLTLVPEGMTLEKLESLTLNPKQGYKIGLRAKDNKWVQLALSQHGKTSSGRAHWVLMPNDVIPNSRKKPWADQQVMADSYKSQEYELLSMIDGSVCLLLEHVQTGKRFYSDIPYTYTRCAEEVQEGSSQWPAAIGRFAFEGLCVFYDDDSAEANEDYGLGLARKFF